MPSLRTRSPLPEKLMLGLAVTWVALVFDHFFPFHNTLASGAPFGSFFDLSHSDPAKLAQNQWGSLKILFFSLVAALTLWRWGKRGLDWIETGPMEPAIRFCLEIALGILFFNALWLGLGLNLLWSAPFLLSVFLLLSGFAFWDLSQDWKGLRPNTWMTASSPLFLALVAMGLVFLMLSLLQGLIPEVYYDGVVYHLATLRFWQSHHGITNFFTNLYSCYPFGGELYFLNGLILQGSETGETAKLLNVLISELAALAVLGWVREEGGGPHAWTAWALVLSFPLVSTTVWTTQTDVVLAFFFILFFYALTRWASRKEDWRWAILAGLLGGGALTVKYTALLGWMLALLILALTQKDSLRLKYWPQWGWIKGLAYLSLCPWLLKNLIFTGNPIYPYLSSVIGGVHLPADQMTELMWDHDQAFLGDANVLQWLSKIFTRDLDKTIAPILFAFLPFLFLGWKKRTPLTTYLALLCTAWLVAGFLVSHQLRLLMPAFLTIFLLTGLVLADLKNEKAGRLWEWTVLLFGLLSLIPLVRLSVMFYRADQVLTGRETRVEYLQNNPQTAEHFALAQAARDLLPLSDRLLVAGDARGAYYWQPFYTNSVFDEQVLARLARQEKDGPGIRQRLREMGVDDLVVAGEEGMRLSKQYHYYDLTDEQWTKLEGFLQAFADPVYLKGKDAIYRLRPEPVIRKGRVPDQLLWFRNAQKRT